MAGLVPLDNRSELLPSTTSAMGSDWVYSNKYEFPMEQASNSVRAYL